MNLIVSLRMGLFLTDPAYLILPINPQMILKDFCLRKLTTCFEHFIPRTNFETSG